MTVSGVNFGKAADDYGTHRAGFPDSLFDRLGSYGIGARAEHIVDLGTGTGTLARGFAQRGCVVVGLDPDARMLDQARKLSTRDGLSIDFKVGSAEQTGLPDGSADVVAAGQCWHWFDQRRAPLEVRRLLRRDGRLLIAHFDWLPLMGNVVHATETLIQRYNPRWHLGGGNGMHPEWMPVLGGAGFRDIESFSYDVDVPYTPDAWRGRIRASAGVVALDETSARRFDASLAELLKTQYGSSVLQVPHRVFAIVARRPPT